MAGDRLLPTDIIDVFRTFVLKLKANEQTLNAINVFPIADCDTGTNLATLTTAEIAALAGGGIDKLDATDDAALTRTVTAFGETRTIAEMIQNPVSHLAEHAPEIARNG